MKKLRTKLPQLTTKKITLIILGAVLLLAVIAVVWSNYTWGRYVASNNSRYETAVGDITAQLAGVESVGDIESIREKATSTADQLCYTSILTGLRTQLLGDAQQYLTDCQDRQERLRIVANQSSQVTDRLATENRVAGVLQKASQDLKDTKDADYLAQQGLWRQSAKELSSITPHDSYADTLKAQQDAIKSIIKRYDNLIKADKAESRTDFDDAVVELRAAYGQLGDTRGQATTSYRNLTRALYDAVEGL